MRFLIFVLALVATFVGLVMKALRGPEAPKRPELWTYRTTPKDTRR
jgi:hypothetical protein